MKDGIISKELLDILACPACKVGVELVEYEEEKYGLECSGCKRIYPIKEGIPVMMLDEAIFKNQDK